MKNPFYNRQRITDPVCFFGRKTEIDILYSAVVTHQCRALVGERKIGKSSLLTYIRHPQVMARYGLDPERQIILYLDLEGMASATPTEFWCELLDQLGDRVTPELGASMRSLSDSGEVRFMQVRRLLRRLRDSGYDLALCLDEFEALARSAHFDSDFFGELRSLAGELGLVYLTASKRSLYELTYENSDTLSSPFFNIFTDLPLSVLDESEAVDLLRDLSCTVDDSGFCPEEIQFALRLAGTHPFFLQLAGFHLFDIPGHGAPRSPEVLEQVRRRFNADAEDHYRYLWSQLSLTLQGALVNLYQAAEQEIRLLRNRNLIREQNNLPIPFNETFAEFLQRQNPDHVTLTGPKPPVIHTGTTDLTGKTIGPYRVISPLGRGGMAEVYKGYQPLLDRYVALKILATHLAGDPEFRERFQREAAAVARLHHPSIVQVFDFAITDTLTYMVMEYIPGITLKERLRESAGEGLPHTEVLQIARGLAGALDHAHSHGLIHRDVKPANILLRETGYHPAGDAGDSYAVLTDFGVAKMLEGIQYTEVGTTLGTPDYMSPEQAQGVEITPVSDVYSLAVVVFEMLAGKLPFTAPTPTAVLLKHMGEEIPSLHTLNPVVPTTLDPVMSKGLAKKPEKRFASAGELVLALEAAL